MNVFFSQRVWSQRNYFKPLLLPLSPRKYLEIFSKIMMKGGKKGRKEGLKERREGKAHAGGSVLAWGEPGWAALRNVFNKLGWKGK
jgi:hypothetical protein